MADSAVPPRSTGLNLFTQQSKALLVKNYKLSLRSKLATFLQLVSSLFFVFLVFAVDRAIQARTKDETTFKNLFQPQRSPVGPIPKCEDGFFMKKPCLDFVYSNDNNSPQIKEVVNNIHAQHSRQLRVREFLTPQEVDEYLLTNPMTVGGALLFTVLDSTVSPPLIGYGLQTNATVKNVRGIYEDSVLKFQIPLQMAAEWAIANYTLFNTNSPGGGRKLEQWNVTYSEYAHPAVESFSGVAVIGPLFFLAATMFGFVIQMGAIVQERELKLRQAMSTMGLMNSVFWLTWLVWELLLVFISSILLVLFGMMFQFDFFRNNDFGVLFFTFFLFQLNMVGFAFMFSTFISKSSSATTLGFVVFILGVLTQFVTTTGLIYREQTSSAFRNVWSFWPPNLLALALSYLGKETATPQSPGISWGRRDSKCEDCLLSLADVWGWMIGTFFLWFVLAVYLDNVLPDPNGVKRPCFYFLQPSYWTGKGSVAEGGGCCTCMGSVPEAPQMAGRLDEDVVTEMEQVQAAVKHGSPGSGIAVQVRGLVKTYAGRRELKCGCCCTCQKIPPFHAVKGSWFNIEKDKLFCLLGPNGAGKTTTINCLTGVIPTTAGDAIVNGESIRSPEGMTRIRSTMGVCPQFDILWDTLTGREHLWMFANIKGLPSDRIQAEIEELLQSVKLVDAGNMRSASYSGGMKRRLSVAIALIGNPKIVYLDEPTTGMDPISRRHVWDVVEKAKKGRAIVLTTHSMEEADILGDRIAIMAKGQLRCIGTSIHLKTRFGAGYIMNVSVKKGSSTAVGGGGGGGDGSSPVNQKGSGKDDMDAKLAPVLAFFKQTLGVEPNEINKAYVSFLIPRSKEGQLSKFFATLRDRKKELGITDTQLSLTTLEEVFLNIAKQAELESAAAEGRFEKLTLGDGRTISVPVGAQYVLVPESISQDVPNGLMVEVFWQQDEQGSLRISGSSDPKPAPARRPEGRPAVQPSLSSRSSFGLSMGRRVEPSGSYDNPLRVEVIDMEDVRRGGQE
ncbi:hypothetical protein CBR_g21052 [Chara braunii]|uniref:ABC transporter domain-containing protein n=1 Tax=Chara braunii TaxID=69332 RepID=A0A388L0H5_CHABU|nr:hypothetical protein CBR_g21052 [Chara braunii]|eukprot:GBG75807.1 hypothetical protein CBR_g21052 [Chara braunii]